jgi:hypothetical protein
VQKFFTTFLSASVAVTMIVLAAGTGQLGRAQTAPAKKSYKDAGESELYNKVVKDAQGKDWKQAVADLDTWKQKYAGSDFKNDREVFYIQAYAGQAQYGKAVDTGGALIDADISKIFDDPKYGPGQQLTILFTTVQAIPQIQNPTPEQLAIGDKAAHVLMDYNTKPEGANDAAWAQARQQMSTMAKGVQMYIVTKPGADALQKKDYPAAEAAYTKALQAFPDSGQIAYQLGTALVAQQATDPTKISAGVYEIARGAALDPAKGGIADPAARTAVETYLNKIYTRLHGSNEGLDQLKQQALASPTPPAGFHIKTSSEIAAEKEAEFEKSSPQLAMWMKIKGALTDTNGDQYFESSMKDAQVPKLKGILVDAKPACRPKELLVAVPLPDAKTPYPTEISLKLVDADGKPEMLTGKPELNTEFQWEGVPKAYAKEPFLLTMDTDKTKLEGLKVTPCAAAPVHHPAAKKKAE